MTNVDDDIFYRKYIPLHKVFPEDGCHRLKHLGESITM